MAKEAAKPWLIISRVLYWWPKTADIDYFTLNIKNKVKEWLSEHQKYTICMSLSGEYPIF
jgi:hypothetical protein